MDQQQQNSTTQLIAYSTIQSITAVEAAIRQSRNEAPLSCRNDIADAVKKCLAYVALQVGIKEVQLPEVIDNTVKFIIKRFSMLTAKEVILAFEMNAAGDYPVKHEHYQQMNMVYVGAVLNSYRAIKRQACRDKTNPEADTYEKPTDGGKSSYLAILQYVEENKEVPTAWDWQLVYDYMTGIGLVNETNEWKAEFKEKVREQMQLEKTAEYIEANQIQRMKISYRYNEQSLIDRCRAEYVKNHLKNHISK